MEKEIDSLNEIIAIIGNKGQTDSWSQNQDTYQIMPNNENHVTSFGAGGRMSQVVDPDFRAPSSVTLANDTANNMSSINSSEISNIDLNTIPLPISNQLTRPSTTVTFTLPEKTTTFSDLARRPPAETFTTSSIQLDTLQEYGPVPSEPIHVPPHNVAQLNRNASYATQQQYISPVPPSSSSNYVDSSMGFQNFLNPHSHFQPQMLVNNYASTSQSYTFTPNSVPVSSDFNGPDHQMPQDNRPMYPPTNNSSPPLDDINIINSNTVLPDQSANSQTTNKIPKISTSTSSSSCDKYDELNLLQLQKKYREFEREYNEICERRKAIEKTLNDMTRSNHGKNIELDPLFRQKKEDQKHIDSQHNTIRSEKRNIAMKLETKFNYKITPAPPRPVVPIPSRRAKMSTGAPVPKVSKSDDSIKNYTLSLRDPRTFCKNCDEHFDSLKEYCEHIHSRSHNIRNKAGQPWNKPAFPLLDNRKTYDIMKSMCAKLFNECKKQIDIRDVDRVMDPNLSSKDKAFKNRFADREQGRFRKDDRLFEFKGYEQLTPINGFYCSLCDSALCDPEDAERHIKGYRHNYNVIKSIAFDPTNQRTFTIARDKSYKRQFGEEEDSPKEPKKSPVKEVSKTSKTTVINLPAFQAYKKPTSHIVDDHEVLGDSHPKKKTVSGPTKINDTETIITTDNLRKKIAAVAPEIVPIGSCQPSALKRLRTQPSAPTTKTTSTPAAEPVATTSYKHTHIERVSPPSTSSEATESPEDSERVQPAQEIHLNSGDPDSPFPDLNLRVTGNTHVSVLKDMRLAQPCKIVLKKLDLSDWQNQLLDEATMWTRVHQLMAKKEPDQISKELRSKDSTRPTYFSVSGASIPVDVDKNEDEKVSVDSKPKLSVMISDKKSDAIDNLKPETTELGFDDIDYDDNDSDIFAGPNNDKNMNDLLDNFFVD